MLKNYIILLCKYDDVMKYHIYFAASYIAYVPWFTTRGLRSNFYKAAY